MEMNKFAVSTIKNTAKNCIILQKKLSSIKSKMDALAEEYTSIQSTYMDFQLPIRKMTGAVLQEDGSYKGGFTTMDLVDVVREDSGKQDKLGKEIFVTRYNLKYPDTIIPPTIEEPAFDDNSDEEVHSDGIYKSSGENASNANSISAEKWNSAK